MSDYLEPEENEVQPTKLFAVPRMYPWDQVTAGGHEASGPEGSCGLMLCYDSLAAFKAQHPDKEPLVFDVG